MPKIFYDEEKGVHFSQKLRPRRMRITPKKMRHVKINTCMLGLIEALVKEIKSKNPDEDLLQYTFEHMRLVVKLWENRGC